MNQYQKLAKDNMEKLYSDLPSDLAKRLGAQQIEDHFIFHAFGESCQIGRGGIMLNQQPAPDVQGLLISLYALCGSPDPLVMEPFKAFKDFPDSMPYVGAFASHTEHVLIPHVENIMTHKNKIMTVFSGMDAPASFGGDFSFIVYPLPKTALCYIFYLSDEDFPASATCLYSSNANTFLPMDALADVGEYTSKKILRLIAT